MTKRKTTSVAAEEPESTLVGEAGTTSCPGPAPSDAATEAARPNGSQAATEAAQPTGPSEAALESAAAEAPPAEADVASLACELEAARKLAEEHWDTVLRTRAELDNLRKRSQREVENAHKYGLERLMSELLPVQDSLELGLSAARDEDVEVEKVREGLELTLKMLRTATGKFGLREVDPMGEAFDPEYHQAITVQEAADQTPGTVVNVIQKGYLLHDRLVRPAMVIVTQ